nr:piwi-like protein 1 [Mirounga angustirostris]
MTGRARARARGRARGQETVQHVGAAASQQPGYVQPRPQQPAAEGELVGRGRQRGAVGAAAKSQELQISAGFQELSLAERGGRRRDFHDLGVNTRQNLDHVKESKTGSSGIIVRLSTNHFRLTSRPQWALYQYHIDYNPLMEARRLRSALLFQHEDLIGRCHAFDGTILFLPKRLQHKVTEVFSQTRNGEHVRITITLTNELPPTSPTCLQFYNIIFRRLLKIMNLQQIGRNYYNPSDPIDIPNHRLVIWPGFTTSILQYENNIMLCTDVSHKVLRSETVLDFMFNLYHQTEEHKFQEQVSKELIGLIVLTKYNNKTYRVDDIDWDQNPKSTFKKADGSEVSFLEYYRKWVPGSMTDSVSLHSSSSPLSPRLTVIVVKKRVNARFFAQSGGRLQNPLPGTVIDVEVTRPEWYDFFIVSQAVRSGSVSPTHYNVIYDSSGLKPDHIQRLTYKLCHVYYNWPGVIRVPAPCQYAHKLAFLVGQSIHREPNLSLSNRLYYL